MTDLEILAELKIAYLLLDDIQENAECDQVDYWNKIKLLEQMSKLNEQYINVYNRIIIQDNDSLYYKQGIKIGYDISIDYTLEDTEIKEAITYKDIDNEEKWWEDYKFLTK